MESTERKLFEPIGEVSKKEIVYKLIHDKDYNTEFTYEQLQAITGFDIKNKERNLVYEVNKLLLKNDQKLLINIRYFGYKIAKPDEQMNHAGERKKRAKRQLTNGISELTNTNDELLTSEEKIKKVHSLNHLQTILNTARKRNIEGIEKAKESVKAQIDTRTEIDKALDLIKKQLGVS